MSYLGNTPQTYVLTPNALGVSYSPPFTGSVPTNVGAVLSQTVSAQNFGAYSAADISQINAAIAYAISAGVRVKFSFPAVIRVPEDAPTIQAALDSIYPDPTVGFLLTVRISSGYEIANGTLIQNGDFSNVEITSIDATVNLGPSFTGVAGGDTFSANSLFVTRDAVAPRWRILVDCDDRGGGLVYQRAKGFVAGAKGVMNSSEYCLYVNTQSSVVATNAIFTGAGYGNRVTVNSQLNAPQANFSGTKNQLYVGSNRAANLDVSRGSLVYITGALGAETNLTGGVARGLAVRRSFVSATSVNVSNVGQEGLAADLGSVVAFNGSIANNCGLHGVVSSGSFVSFNDTASAMNNAVYNLYADNGGRIMARNATLTGAGVNGVLATNGGEITIPGANCRRNGVSDQASDIAVLNGGYVSAVGALGGTNSVPLSNDVAGSILKETASVRIRTAAGTNVNSIIDFDFPSVTSANADLRFWRNTNTTGLKRLLFQRGDGTSALDVQIGVGGTSTFFNSGSVSIGSSAVVPSAVLNVDSTTRGLLLPRMTTIQRDAIASPIAGLLIFNTTTDTAQIRTSTAWVSL